MARGAASRAPFVFAARQREEDSSSDSVELGHQAVLDHLGLRPLFDLDLRLGEGTGAALAFHMVEAAVRILNEMATFAEAGVSGKEE